MTDQPLSHVDDDGKLRMVDVSSKSPTRRRAEASCVVRTTTDVFSLAPSAHGLNVVHAARLAGVQGAKSTAALIPLCHPIDLHDAHVEITEHPLGVGVHATVVTVDRTGVEMEALTACALSALTILDALVANEPTARLEDLVVLSKSGGKSSDWGRDVT